MKIETANQFTATPENIAIFLKDYNATLIKFQAAKSGIENSTFIVDTDIGEKILRIYRHHKKTDDQIYQEIEFMDYIGNHNLKVPKILPNKNHKLLTKIHIDGLVWQAILMDFVHSTIKNSYTPRLIQSMATTQAKMHILSSSFKNRHKSIRLNELKESQFIKNIRIDELTNDSLIGFVNRAEKYHIILDDKLPRGLCHLDYDIDNILFDENGDIAATIDFDDLADSPYVVDLAYTLYHLQYLGNKEMLDKYLAIYEQLRPLTNLERSYIKPIELFRHYVVSCVSILNGKTSQADTIEYIELEKQFF